MKTMIFAFLLFIAHTTAAQTGVLMQRYYIAGSLSLGQNNRAFSDQSAWLQMGPDTTNRGVLFPKVLLDSINTAARALFVYDLKDSVLYHFDGTSRIRYMTYKDSSFIKQLIADNAPDLSPLIPKTDTARNSYVATYTYTDSISNTKVKYSDSSSFLPTKTFLLNNYFNRSGNSFGQAAALGTIDNYNLDLVTANTTRLRVFANGNIGIATTADAGYKLDVNGASRLVQLLTLNDELFFENTSKGINITSAIPAGRSLVIGSDNTGFETDNLKIGYSLKGSPVRPFVINMGYLNDASGANSYSTVTGTYNFITNSDAYAQIFGSFNSIGYTPNSISEGSTIVGAVNTIAHQYSAIFGYNQSTTASNQLILAQSRSNGNSCGFNDVYFGTGPRSDQLNKTGPGVTLNASGAGYDTDKDGGFLRMAAGRSTGAAPAPDLIFATATSGASGSTLQTLTNRWYVKGETGYLSNATLPTSLVDLDGATGYNQLRMRMAYTPASTADTNGHTGDMAWDDDYLYIKTSVGWRRTALAGF